MWWAAWALLVRRLKERSAAHPSGLEVRLGRLRAAQKGSPCNPPHSNQEKILVCGPSPCFASWKLEKGRRKVGGGRGCVED